MRKAFIESETEEELGICRYHFLLFLLPFLLHLPMSAAAIVILYVGGSVFNGTGTLFYYLFLILWLLFSFFQLLKHFVAWRFNSIIITSEKIILIQYKSVFYRDIDPIPLDNIISVRAETQFLGIFNCGILHFHLKEREAASTRELHFSYLKYAERYAGIIQKAIARDKHEMETIT